MKIKSCAAAVVVAAGVLAAAPATVQAAVPAPVRNGDLVFIEQQDTIVTQVPGPANAYTPLTNGMNPKYARDGKQLAFTRQVCDPCSAPGFKDWLDVEVRALATGAERRVARFTYDVFNWRSDVTWSPDGKSMVVSSDHSLVKVVVATGRQTVIFSNRVDQEFVSEPAWSPDGTRIAFTLGGKAIKLINPDGTGIRTFTATGTQNEFADWSPDSRTIAFVTDRFRGQFNTEVVTLPRSGTGTPVRVSYSTRPAGRLQNGVAWSPDGKKIAVLELYNPTDPDEERATVRGYLPDGSHSYSLTGPIAGDDRPEGLDWAPKR